MYVYILFILTKTFACNRFLYYLFCKNYVWSFMAKDLLMLSHPRWSILSAHQAAQAEDNNKYVPIL